MYTNEYILYFIGSSLVFGSIVEYNIGNICYRTNELGDKSLDLKKMISFMISPLYKKEMWYISMLPYNYLVFIGITCIPFNFLY